jgi:Na+/melibiose symporter-like transporter
MSNRNSGAPEGPKLGFMTLRRWRLWFVLGMSLVMLSVLNVFTLFRDGDSAWAWFAAIGIGGVTVIVVSAIRRRPTEKQEVAARAAAGPDPRRWRVVEQNDDK